ncbi:hypothetical protein [Trinickia sp.]|uniref:hypothetical protein n=1 Tax=Trinickia sp. TaxID=2571163 RepID=UPI003F811BE7
MRLFSKTENGVDSCDTHAHASAPEDEEKIKTKGGKGETGEKPTGTREGVASKRRVRRELI